MNFDFSSSANIFHVVVKFLEAFIVLIIGIKTIRTTKKCINSSKKSDKLPPGIRSFLTSFIYVGLYAILFIIVATILGVPTSTFITILASCGVAIGLALQGTLSNFAGGLIALFFDTFDKGDYIESSGESGTVEDITVFHTLLVTDDNKHVLIPNGILTNSIIRKYSADNFRPIDFIFSVSDTNNMEKVKKIIYSEIVSHPMVLSSPQPFVRLSDHSGSSLVFTARVWCKKDHYWTVKFDIIENVEEVLEKNSILI